MIRLVTKVPGQTSGHLEIWCVYAVLIKTVTSMIEQSHSFFFGHYGLSPGTLSVWLFLLKCFIISSRSMDRLFELLPTNHKAFQLIVYAYRVLYLAWKSMCMSGSIGFGGLYSCTVQCVSLDLPTFVWVYVYWNESPREIFSKLEIFPLHVPFVLKICNETGGIQRNTLLQYIGRYNSTRGTKHGQNKFSRQSIIFISKI